MGERKGYRLDVCRQCHNTANKIDTLVQKIEVLLENEDLLNFLQQRVKGKLRPHHLCRVALAACPNGCSQPQIKDVGIISAHVPLVSDTPCTACEACVRVCKEDAVQLHKSAPIIDLQRCVACGQCVTACPTGTIVTAKRGFRVQLGGKLGRHPRLAKKLPVIFSEEEVVAIIEDALSFYKIQSKPEERFADAFHRFSKTLLQNQSQNFA